MSTQAGSRASARSSGLGWIWGLICLAVIGVIGYNARVGAVSPRIANPQVHGVPRPVEFLLGIDWIPIQEFFTVVTMLLLVAVCIMAWRRRPGHPYVLMAIACTAIVWQDPIMNWSPYAVYNPQLWHWPEDWPLVRLSPTVEPFVVIGYAMFYFGPYFPAVAVLRRLQARQPMDAFAWRHPLWCMAGLILVFGFVIDMLLEVTLVRTGMYIYSQTIPFGTLFAGTTFQFPLIWESSLVTLVMIPAGILVYRDDTGRTVADKLAQQLKWLPNRPVLASFLVMFGILNLAYFMYGGAFALIRVSGLNTAVACPYPYPEAKVYDPQGYYEREGQPGPYFQGYWNGLTIGMPNGRPEANPVKADAACLPKSAS
jgi:hypothetical protein